MYDIVFISFKRETGKGEKMKKRTINIILAAIFFIAFGIFTYLVKTVDVAAIGPMGSSVGFSSFNKEIMEKLPQNDMLYELTNLLGYFCIFICAFFGLIGLKQLIETKSLFKVDRDLICLGILYLMAIAVYVIFMFVVVNYRPILEDGVLEAGYPSSHTVLGITVFASLIVEIRRRITDPLKALIEEISCWAFICIMIACRFLSGYHWATDIIGGVILTCALVFTFKAMLPELNHCKGDFAKEALEKIKEENDKKITN